MIRFFNDRKACVEYFNRQGVILSPDVVRKIFEDQAKGRYVNDAATLKRCRKKGYLNVEDVHTVRGCSNGNARRF